MEIIVSGRHLEVDETLRAYAEDKLAKLELEYPKLTSARVVASSERGWQIVEAHLNGKHLSLNAKGRSKELTVSIDAAVEKLDKQLRKHLERLHDHRPHRPHERQETALEQDDEEEEWMADEAAPEEN